MPELWEPLKTELERIVGADRVLCDRASRLRFGCDWTRVYDPDPVAVVLPGSVAEIQAIVRFAAANALASSSPDSIAATAARDIASAAPKVAATREAPPAWSPW